MPPAYVKPFVKRQKNDAADAEAICEAFQRPNRLVRQLHLFRPRYRQPQKYRRKYPQDGEKANGRTS
jgi:transposase